MHFEIKTKGSYSYRETERSNTQSVWLNKKSIDYKYEQWLDNKKESYVVVVFFYDKGYYAFDIAELKEHEDITFRYAPDSNDEIYVIPLKYFTSFDVLVSYLIERNNLSG